jgi:hypothetical protein
MDMSASFTLWLLYPEGRRPRYRLSRRLREAHTQSEYSGKEKNPYPCHEFSANLAVP